MKTPNEYYDKFFDLADECRNSLIELFKEHNITALDTDTESLSDKGITNCFAHLWDRYTDCMVSAVVSKVFIVDGRIHIYTDEFDLDGDYDLVEDCYKVDIFNIYRTCYELLTKKEG